MCKVIHNLICWDTDTTGNSSSSTARTCRTVSCQCIPLPTLFVVLDVRHDDLRPGKEPFPCMLLNSNKHTSVGWGLVGENSVGGPFLNSNSGVTIAKPVYKMHIGAFLVHKWQPCTYGLLCTYHSTKLLHCTLSHLLLALWRLHE
jgi:hypothetical protein